MIFLKPYSSRKELKSTEKNLLKDLIYDARLYFLIFTLSNFLLSYSRFNLQTKFWICLIGILFPLTLGLLTSIPISTHEKIFFSEEFLDRRAKWLGIVLVGLAVSSRFYKLVSLPAWPMWDDALISYFSIRQFQHWTWQLTYTSEKLGPLYFWLQALFFKLCPPSFFSIRLFQEILSTLALPLGWWTLRQFFSNSYSLWGAAFLAIGFWPLYLGQFCSPLSLVVLWQLFCVGLLGLCLKSLKRGPSLVLVFALGLGMGLGIYIWIVNLVTFFFLASLYLWIYGWNKPTELQTPACFIFGALLLILPIASDVFTNLSAGHVYSHLIFSQPNPLKDQWTLCASYLSSFLWGSPAKSFCFGPFWGGFLNPIWGSTFLLGLVELFRFRKKPFFYWIIGGLGVSLLPALLSKNLELMRLLPVLPWVVGLTTLGSSHFLMGIPKAGRIPIIIFLFSTSFGLDLYHLWGPYHQWAIPGLQSGPYKSPERFNAFKVLETKEGSGFLLADLVPDIFDQSLFTATYPFNAAVNPSLEPNQVRWTALFINARYQAYLVQHFPECRIYPLSEGFPRADGPLILAWFPLSPLSNPLLNRWLQAHQSLDAIFSLMPYHTWKSNYGPVLQALKDRWHYFEGDSFLESCFWDKLASIEESDNALMDQARQSALRGVAACSADPLLDLQCGHFWQKLANYDEYYYRNDVRTIDALHHVIQKKYHVAQAYRQLIDPLTRMGKKEEAASAAKFADHYQLLATSLQP